MSNKLCWKDRFWNKVRKLSDEECWPWIASTTGNGYGHMQKNGVHEYAHRISWELHFGVVPESMDVLHKCDNPPCVNPNHPFLGGARENIKDMWNKEKRPRRVLAGYGLSGFRGVLRYNERLWQAKIYRPKQEHLGLYSTITEAKLAVLIYESVEGRHPGYQRRGP
jgi:hypothetical protein